MTTCSQITAPKVRNHINASEFRQQCGVQGLVGIRERGIRACLVPNGLPMCPNGADLGRLPFIIG